MTFKNQSVDRSIYQVLAILMTSSQLRFTLKMPRTLKFIFISKTIGPPPWNGAFISLGKDIRMCVQQTQILII